MSWCEMLKKKAVVAACDWGRGLGLCPVVVWVMFRGQGGDKGLTDSKDKPGAGKVGEVRGRASAETPRFMAPRTAGSGTRHC